MKNARLAWRSAGVVVGAASLLALREGSILSWRMPAAERAHVRLSWSTRPERVERCRRLSDSELSALPAHMRLRLQCEGGFARYLLTVRLDSGVVAEDTLAGGGLRHDRPIHVLRDVNVPPGERRIRVDVIRLDSTTTTRGNELGEREQGDTLLGGRASREADERLRRAREAMPARLVFDTTMVLRPSLVLLVVYDDQGRRLAAKSGLQ